MNFLWRIELFGGLRVGSGERVMTRFRTHKTASLLAYLALFPERPHSREELCDLLWPEADLDAGRMNLRVALSSLRRQMEPPGTPHGSVLVADRSNIHLNPAVCTTDIAEFEAALEAASKPGADEAALLTRAVSLYRGDLLPEIYDDWALGARERLAQAALGALHQLTRLLTKTGDFDRALDPAHRALARDPLCEKSHRLLMRLYAAMGRPDAARQQYQTLTQLLRVEMNAAPSSKTRDLAAHLDDPSAEREAASPTTLSPAPGRPQSLLSPDAPAEHAPSDSLPVTWTRFFGRAAEREHLTALLCDPRTRLVTLTGPGGNGKTRLAVEAARGLAGPFPGGIWFVPLADIADPRRLGDAVRAALRLPRTADPWGLVVAALSGPPALLVLDNFEQIAAGAAPAVQSLLERVPALTCLVTSRRCLDVPGEREMPVAPLPVPDAAETAEQLSRSASAQVFVDRAQAVRPDFAVTDRNVADLAALCRALEGVPLALELAAARVRALSLAQMRVRLDQRFELLASRRGDKGTRHRSLWAAIEWSYDLLPAPSQRFFALLSVFRGGWTLEAAEAVCENPDALEALAQLRANSLLLAEDGLTDLRFRLLESLREFAWEQLAPNDREAAGERHAVFFLSLARQADEVLQGPEQGDWLRRFEADAANLLLALDWLNVRPDRTAEALAMTTALYHFWLLSGRQHEGRARLDALLVRWVAPDAARADALTVAGNLAEAEGDLPGARACMEEGIALNLRLGREEQAARGHGDLGIIASRQGRLPEAQAHWEATTAYWQGRNEPRRAAATLNNLGILARRQGDLTSAQTRFLECLALYRQVGDTLRVATVPHNLGLTAQDRGDLDESGRWLEEGLAIQQALGNARGAAITLHGLGTTAHKRSRFAEAQAFFAESLTTFTRTEDTGGILHCLRSLVETWLALDLPEPAAVAWGALTVMYQAGEITPLAGEAEAQAGVEQALRTALGPARFDAAHARGAALSPMQAAEHVLSVCRAPAA